MSRNLQALDTLETGVFIPVEFIGKQALHGIAAKIAWWQADAMQHDQIDLAQGRARTEIR